MSDLLDRNLSWVAAADSKVAPILAIDTAMMGVLSALVPGPEEWSASAASAASLSAVALLASLVFLGVAVFPRLSGPKGSLVYFGGIVTHSLTSYQEEILAASEEALQKDLASQIYRNAEIADLKFRWVRNAMVALFVAIPFWLWAIALLYNG